MLFDKFIAETKAIWEKYFNNLEKLQNAGDLNSNDCKILFPNILLVSNCSGFFSAELIGAQKDFVGLNVKRHREESIYRYLNQFEDSQPNPLFVLNGENNGLRGLCLSHEVDYQTLKKRFPSIDLYTSKIRSADGKGSVISFGDKFESCFIENCVLINTSRNLFRCKNILSLYIFCSGISKNKMKHFYKYHLSDTEAKGIHLTIDEEEERLLVAGQLQNMYQMPGLRETTIGDFLKLHPEIIKRAFKTDEFKYEPYLEWKEHGGTCDDTAINPDLLIKRNDGYYDIYDIKKSALFKKNITKGGSKRRRFIDYVEEGAAQLANYREYFTYSKNVEHAKNKYDVEVKDPKLVLVVGNWDNASFEEVEQAQRRYSDIFIIDYDTFCHLFIGTSLLNT